MMNRIDDIRLSISSATSLEELKEELVKLCNEINLMDGPVEQMDFQSDIYCLEDKVENIKRDVGLIESNIEDIREDMLESKEETTNDY